MSGFLPSDHARSRVRWAWLGGLVLLAFVGGLLTARYALTRVNWLRPAAIAAAIALAAEEPLLPAQPAPHTQAGLNGFVTSCLASPTAPAAGRCASTPR